MSLDAQKWAMEETRLGIPILFHEESLHGFAAKDATAFPQSIGLASTWDPDLVREINDLIAGEVRARGVHLVLSPVVDVARDARWGRIEETFGEDPYLVGEMGVASVEGLTGVGTDRTLKDGPGDGHAEAHDRPRTAGKRHQCRPCPDQRAHLARNVLPAVRTGRDPHRHRRGDGEL